MAKTQDELNQKKGQTQKDIRDIQKQIDNLFIDWKEQESKRVKELEQKRAQMPQIIVNGPQVAVAGAKNSYEIELRQDAGQNAPNQFKNLPGVMQQPMNMQARVVNQKTQDVMYSQQLKMQANNRANFDLPPDLPIKPGDDIALEFLSETPEGKLIPMRDNLKLVFPDFVTHLATDRPMYRPGETVRFRSLTLERFSLKPAQQKFHLRYRIVGPNNTEIFKKEAASELVVADRKNPDQQDALKGPGGAPLFGVGARRVHALPPELAEGEYTLYASEINERFPEEKRSFLVRRWQAPRLNKEMQFNRASYGPGDQVKIFVRAIPVQGQAGFRNNIQITARIVVDGVKLHDQNRQTDNDGRAEFEFTLPQQIFKGNGVVSVKCSDGGNVETVVRTLPIVLRDLHVDFYPEGGDLLFDTANRVYFQARTPAGKPADMQGAVLDERKQEVVRIQTLTDDKEPGINQGMGAFTFTPKLGKRYALRIDSPIGIDRPMPLPAAKDRGVVLSIPQGLVDGEINMTLHNVDRRARAADRRVLPRAHARPQIRQGRGE